MAATSKEAVKAIREGKLADLMSILRQNPKLAKESGPTLLKYAAEADRVDLLDALVTAGADVNAAWFSDTPLGVAVSKGKLAAAAWLLDHGADVNGRASADDATPLHEAITSGQLKAVELLLDRGADPTLTFGNPARNAVAQARFWEQDDIAAFLESRGCSEKVVESEPVDVEASSFQKRDVRHPEEWFEKKWWHVYDYGTRRGLPAMSEKNRVFFLVGYLIDQLIDGGVDSVYTNPSGAYVALMPAALDTIGATRAAAVLREINALFPRGTPSADDKTREQQMRKLGSKVAKLGAELERTLNEQRPKGSGSALVARLYDFYHADGGSAKSR